MKKKKKDPNVYLPGLDAAKVKRIIDCHDHLADEDGAEEIASAPLVAETAWIEVPVDLLPRVRQLIARRRRSA